MKKIDKDELKRLFLASLEAYKILEDEKNPFLLKYRDVDYYIFLKNLSPAYFKNSPDVTRIQIPTSDHFKQVLKSENRFLVFGYDSDNETYTTWNPSIIKRRLNAKDNISIYSRSSIQQEAKSAKSFVKGYLSNGEEFICFKREFLKDYFNSIDALFSPDNKPSGSSSRPSTTGENPREKPTNIKITPELLALLIPQFEDNLVLKSIGICLNYFEQKGEQLSFKQAFELVTNEYEKYCHN